MKKLSFLSALLIYCSALQAQDLADNKTELTSQEKTWLIGDVFNERNVTLDPKYEGVQGSSLLLDNYLPGKVIVNDSITTDQEVLMNIDAIADEVRFKTPNKPERALNNSKFLGVKLRDESGRTLIFKRFRVYEKAFGNLLVQIISESNKFTLVKLVQKQFRRADFQDRGVATSGKPYDYFETVTTYYIKKDNHLFKKIKLEKNALMGLVPSEKINDLEKICKAHHIGSKLDENEAAALLKTIEKM